MFLVSCSFVVFGVCRHHLPIRWSGLLGCRFVSIFLPVVFLPAALTAVVLPATIAASVHAACIHEKPDAFGCYQGTFVTEVQ